MRMNMAPKYVVRRFIAKGIVLLMVALLLSTAIATAYDKPDIVDYQVYWVSEGDTLWNIAKTSNGYGKTDTRNIVDDIKRASKCTSDLKVNQKLYIPIYKED